MIFVKILSVFFKASHVQRSACLVQCAVQPDTGLETHPKAKKISRFIFKTEKKYACVYIIFYSIDS